MIKHYCDLCEKETQPLKHHDFTQFVQISGVVEMDEKEFFARFYVCDSCRSIWDRLAPKFIQSVRDEIVK